MGLGQAINSIFLGSRSLRFAFEITPQYAGDLPPGVSAASIVWEKGSLVSYTEPACVNGDGTAVFEGVVMRQTASIYRQANTLLPKVYTFKVQSVQQPSPASSASSSSSSSSSSSPAAAQPTGTSNSSRRKTVARGKLDLSQFCSAESTGSSAAAAEVQVPLEPQGTLCLTIRTTWLQLYNKPEQGQESSPAQPCGSTSDVGSTTDKTSSIFGSHLSDADRGTCTGSAELDRLLQEAEAATAAKTVPAGPGKGAAGSTCLPGTVFQKPRVVTLDALSKAAAATGAPRGPSKQHCCPADATHGAHQHQHRPAGGVLDVLQQRSSQASPVGAAALSGRLSSRKWHRRASSVRDTPPILETDREGLDTGSFTAAQPATPAGSSTDGSTHQQQQEQQQQLAAAAPAELPLPFGMRPALSTASTAGSCMDEDFEQNTDEEEDGAVWMDVCCSDTAAALHGDAQHHKGVPTSGPEGLRSLSGRMPTWLWPSSRLAVRDVTTDELMRRISSSRDVSALQHMARGLLCERNDWRYKASQAERTNTGLQRELHELRTSETAAQQAESGQLLHKLVEAKLQLAQADLSMQDLKRQLQRERKRHMQAQAKLTSLQSNFDCYIHEQQQQAAACGDSSSRV